MAVSFVRNITVHIVSLQSDAGRRRLVRWVWLEMGSALPSAGNALAMVDSQGGELVNPARDAGQLLWRRRSAGWRFAIASDAALDLAFLLSCPRLGICLRAKSP